MRRAAVCHTASWPGPGPGPTMACAISRKSVSRMRWFRRRGSSLHRLGPSDRPNESRRLCGRRSLRQDWQRRRRHGHAGNVWPGSACECAAAGYGVFPEALGSVPLHSPTAGLRRFGCGRDVTIASANGSIRLRASVAKCWQKRGKDPRESLISYSIKWVAGLTISEEAAPLLRGDQRDDRVVRAGGPLVTAKPRAGGAGRSGGAQGATTRTDGAVAAPAVDQSP